MIEEYRTEAKWLYFLRLPRSGADSGYVPTAHYRLQLKYPLEVDRETVHQLWEAGIEVLIGKEEIEASPATSETKRQQQYPHLLNRAVGTVATRTFFERSNI